MTAYVLGAGGIGLHLQCLLQKARGAKLICRQSSYDRLKASPLKVTGAMEDNLNLDCLLLEDVVNVDPQAPFFIATKAHEALALLEILQDKISETNPIVLCQNGIGIYDEACEILPKNPIVRLLCWIGVQRIDLDHIHIAGIHKFEFASATENQKFMEDWSKVLNDAGVTSSVSTDARLSEWKKALWNITVNGLCAIADAPNGAILDYPALGRVAKEIASEAVRIAKADGVNLSDADLAAVFQSLEKTRDNINATLQDLRAGRHPELEFLNGAVCEVARIHDQKAPLNETIVDIVSYLEKSQKRKP
jgi:2-dehydropantoate 2-reductase